jgi:hypothetical protein
MFETTQDPRMLDTPCACCEEARGEIKTEFGLLCERCAQECAPDLDDQVQEWRYAGSHPNECKR